MKTFTWQDVGDTPDRVLTQAEKETIAEEWNLNEAQAAQVLYIQNRVSEYPPLADQLDKIYHEGIDAWKADIKAIKDKYPKPE